MDDVDVMEALIAGDKAGYGPNVHIEGDVLFAFGWWHLAFRISPGAFMVRNEDDEKEAALIKLVDGALTKSGLEKVLDDHPLVQAITYVEMSLAGPTWSIWASDLASGEAALATRVGEDTIVRGMSSQDMGIVGDFSAELEGARRTAGLPPSIILTVGLSVEDVRALQVALPTCRFEQRQFSEIQPEMCGTLTPSLALVNATEQTGKDFIMQLRAVACGRFLPIASVGPPDEVALGSDKGLNPTQPPGMWKADLLKLLP